MENLVEQLSKESRPSSEAAIAAGATHARFTYADGGYSRLPIRGNQSRHEQRIVVLASWFGISQGSNHKRKAR